MLKIATFLICWHLAELAPLQKHRSTNEDGWEIAGYSQCRLDPTASRVCNECPDLLEIEEEQCCSSRSSLKLCYAVTKWLTEIPEISSDTEEEDGNLSGINKRYGYVNRRPTWQSGQSSIENSGIGKRYGDVNNKNLWNRNNKGGKRADFTETFDDNRLGFLHRLPWLHESVNVPGEEDDIVKKLDYLSSRLFPSFNMRKADNDFGASEINKRYGYVHQIPWQQFSVKEDSELSGEEADDVLEYGTNKRYGYVHRFPWQQNSKGKRYGYVFRHPVSGKQGVDTVTQGIVNKRYGYVNRYPWKQSDNNHDKEKRYGYVLRFPNEQEPLAGSKNNEIANKRYGYVNKFPWQQKKLDETFYKSRPLKRNSNIIRKENNGEAISQKIENGNYRYVNGKNFINSSGEDFDPEKNTFLDDKVKEEFKKKGYSITEGVLYTSSGDNDADEQNVPLHKPNSKRGIGLLRMPWNRGVLYKKTF